MNPDYDKVIEFFSEHETAIYGFGPTDYGAEEGTLLWCIKELDDIYNRSKGIVLADSGNALKNQILNVLCTLIDIYEKEDAEERELNSEITTLMNDLAAKELEVEYLKSKLIKEEEESSTHCETCKNYESMSDLNLIDRDALMKEICSNECGCVCDEECENVMCNYYGYIMMDAPIIKAKPPKEE